MVYRTVDPDFLGGLKPGAVLELNRLTATTLDRTWAERFSTGMIEIRMPSGTPALFIDAAAGGPTRPREAEFLLPPGVRLRIDELVDSPDGPIVRATGMS